MSTPYEPSTLDCQACGKVLKELTPAEAQDVADRPYDFVAFCLDHLPKVEVVLNRETGVRIVEQSE